MYLDLTLTYVTLTKSENKKDTEKETTEVRTKNIFHSFKTLLS